MLRVENPALKKQAQNATLALKHAHWCTERTGCYGIAREFCEATLKAKGQLESAYERFL